MSVTGWPRNLVWGDFRGIDSAPDGVKEDAQIQVDTSPPSRGIRVLPDRDMLKIGEIRVPVTVVRRGSWVVRSRKSDPLLKHEQGHFDITGLVAWELYRALMALRAATASDLSDLLQENVDRAQVKLAALSGSETDGTEGKYDIETKHGTDAKEQKRWDDLIHDSITHHFRALPGP